MRSPVRVIAPYRPRTKKEASPSVFSFLLWQQADFKGPNGIAFLSCRMRSSLEHFRGAQQGLLNYKLFIR